jgi:plastocyanin
VAEQQPVADAGAYGSVPTDAGSQAAQATITIADFSFSDAVMAAPGATVQVANLDSAAHTATADDGAFDTGSIAGGDAGTIVAPAEPGTYTYFCAIHPSMQGTLSVAG